MRTLARLNPYYGPLYDVWRQLVILNGVLFQFSTHIDGRIADLKQVMTHRKVPFYAAASMVIMDLSSVQPDGWPVNFPIGGHLRRGRGYVRMLDDIAAREAAWTVAQGFEAFESAAMNTAALYLKRNPSQLTANAWHKRGKQAKPASARISDYRSFVRSIYRTANDVVRRLGNSSPTLRQFEDHNHRSIVLPAWLDVVAAVRHATVHNSGVLSARQIARLGSGKVKILKTAFRGRELGVGYRLTLTAKDAERALEMLAEYSFLIYKATSIEDELDVSIFRKGRISV